ncbi:MAG: hypothetical protein MI922_28975, partial [Bacteroidales bacterium]|nr:hypothetical protein [Bacteroidales bacterium]
ELRTKTNHIFNGVLEDGTKNNIPVDFAPVDKTVYDNRWVRYGDPGVAEDVIEDASFLQLHKISISYKWNVRHATQIRFTRDIEFSIYARNLFTWSKYKGSNPAQLNWGNTNSLGIDYYSSPMVRRYGASLKVNF